MLASLNQEAFRCKACRAPRPQPGERFRLTTGWDRPRLSAPVIPRAGWPRAQVGDESLLVVPRAPSLLSRLECGHLRDEAERIPPDERDEPVAGNDRLGGGHGDDRGPARPGR